MIHGKEYSYNRGCRCTDCTRAHRFHNAEVSGQTSHPESFNDPWLIIDFPIAVVMRQAFSDDEAIASVT